MTAQIYHFPELRTCLRCVHYAPLNINGYCQMLDRLIRDPEEAAEHCPAFETREDADGEGQ